jgi:hypothetical protein
MAAQDQRLVAQHQQSDTWALLLFGMQVGMQSTRRRPPVCRYSWGFPPIRLTGDEIRMVLDLALKAKLAENKRLRPRLKVVPSRKKGVAPLE